MLRSLSVRNLLLIESLDLEFHPGLNVLTGETGAGKSILLDCLGMALGWRGRGDQVRAGAEKGEVIAEFDLADDHPARAVLAAADLQVDETLILRRVTAADGRKTAFVNDRRATAETISALAETLVEIHGQHDDNGLMNPKGHLALLDEFAGNAGALRSVRQGWRDWQAAEATLVAAKTALDIAGSDADFLRHATDELARFAPKVGEEAVLDTRRRLMQAAARIRADVAKAAQALARDGAEGAITDATRWLEAASPKAEGTLDAPLAALSRLVVELADAQAGVDAALEAMDFDPAELEQTEERLFALRGLARKHGVQTEALRGLAAEFQARLEALETGADAIAASAAAVTAARLAYEKKARTLSGARQTAARLLDAAVAGELAPLKLERARFETRIEVGDPGPDGIDRVTFAVATNPGSPAGPINRIASGGELSRFLLALKVCLHGNGAGLTMIFDEIDRGIGGATADAVGRRLADLAKGSQILVVTHSPQVAARAGHHLLVAKSVAGDVARIDVSALSAAARTSEIARMLAGDTITDAARAAAEALLAG